LEARILKTSYTFGIREASGRVSGLTKVREICFSFGISASKKEAYQIDYQECANG
jgi:hypothetical protein